MVLLMDRGWKQEAGSGCKKDGKRREAEGGSVGMTDGDALVPSCCDGHSEGRREVKWEVRRKVRWTSGELMECGGGGGER